MSVGCSSDDIAMAKITNIFFMVVVIASVVISQLVIEDPRLSLIYEQYVDQQECMMTSLLFRCNNDDVIVRSCDQ